MRRLRRGRVCGQRGLPLYCGGQQYIPVRGHVLPGAILPCKQGGSQTNEAYSQIPVHQGCGVFLVFVSTT